MNEDYQKGYVDAVFEFKNKIIDQIDHVLQHEKDYAKNNPMDEMEWANNQGYISCLNMIKEILRGKE